MVRRSIALLKQNIVRKMGQIDKIKGRANLGAPLVVVDAHGIPNGLTN